MVRDKAGRRASRLIDEIYPLTQHNDLKILPVAYLPGEDVLYLDVIPRSGPKWAETAYKFASQEGAKYDRCYQVYGIDGQPRVSYSGLVYVRLRAPFAHGSQAVLNVISQQPSHEEAEEQLARLYAVFQEQDGLEPIEVFRKFWE